jgi:hypothetical protein
MAAKRMYYGYVYLVSIAREIPFANGRRTPVTRGSPLHYGLGVAPGADPAPEPHRLQPRGRGGGGGRGRRRGGGPPPGAGLHSPPPAPGAPVRPPAPSSSRLPRGAVVQSPPPPARSPCTPSGPCTGIYQRIHRLQYESRETGETAALLCWTNSFLCRTN